MAPLDCHSLPAALAAVGAELARSGRAGRVRVIIAGSTAGLLGLFLKPARITGDVDVLWFGEEAVWRELETAAATVAEQLQLPPNWLNRDVSIWAWCLPLGWNARCEIVGTFHVLEVVRLARIDLIAAKIMSAPKRPHDLEDLQDLKPTRADLDFVDAHIDRLEAEDLDLREFPDQRAVLRSLRGDA